MNKEQIDFLNNKMTDIFSTIDSRELDGIDFSIKIKNDKAVLYIESFPEEGESWNHIELRTELKSLDHLDRLILAVKNLVKELQ
jgi:hypothetical protein